MFNLIIFGPPGSGKGTQSVKIAEKFKLKHVSTGDILREEVKNQTDLGLKVHRMMERGELVPDELLIQILYSVMKNNKHVSGFIFDGFPRTIIQAKALDTLMQQLKSEIFRVISLDVSDKEVIARLLRRAEIEGRKDDNLETINKRLVIYKNQTSPLLDFYHTQNKLIKIKGKGSVEDIFNLIILKLDKCIY